ncbi:DUF551 domain-containing protein [Salmonella enterica subsp. enterica serovar Weltevreden]|nr:DUF551 domain-containing protein [Salmonella enterica subsp. enterica serovar Weltevreden]MDJ6370277.1 DUF551 domain-containing protein [Salmonella enterica]MDJ6428461.1 DUF551 domain-containing protein [Salmonella enterica]
MSNIDQQALREAAQEEIMLRSVSDTSDAWQDEASPEAVLALLGELEAKDKSIGFLKDQLAQLANFNPDWDRLEAAIDSLREHMAKLSAAEKRIAELEALEVVLPSVQDVHPLGPQSAKMYDAGDQQMATKQVWDAMIAAAPQPQNSPQNIPEIIPGWIPVSERMPEVGVKVLCFPVEDEPIHASFNGQLWLQDISWSVSDESIDNVISCNVTHWMPLPASPKLEVK